MGITLLFSCNETVKKENTVAVYFGGDIITMAGDTPEYAEALVINDGKIVFVGSCFPKDTSAFLDFAISFSLLDEVIKSNNKIRSKYTKDKRELEQNISFLDGH